MNNTWTKSSSAFALPVAGLVLLGLLSVGVARAQSSSGSGKPIPCPTPKEGYASLPAGGCVDLGQCQGVKTPKGGTLVVTRSSGTVTVCADANGNLTVTSTNVNDQIVLKGNNEIVDFGDASHAEIFVTGNDNQVTVSGHDPVLKVTGTGNTIGASVSNGSISIGGGGGNTVNNQNNGIGGTVFSNNSGTPNNPNVLNSYEKGLNNSTGGSAAWAYTVF